MSILHLFPDFGQVEGEARQEVTAVEHAVRAVGCHRAIRPVDHGRAIIGIDNPHQRRAGTQILGHLARRAAIAVEGREHLDDKVGGAAEESA